MRQIVPILTLRPLRRLLDMHDVSYSETDKIKKLRQRLRSFMSQLERGKSEEEELLLTGSARMARRGEHKRLRAEWPQVIPDHLKRQLVSEFNLQISAESLATFACGCCNELRPITEKASIPLDEIDIDLLKRPDHVQPESDSDIEVDDVERDPHEPWLDDRCPEPPMPMANTPYSSVLIEPDSLGNDPETEKLVMTVCRQCRSNLKAKRVPPFSIADHYLGPVPPELRDLTVVEEAV
jgi:hypothetical protein